MNRLLAGRVALVTGASRGIGKAIATEFVREGAAVVICGRKQESLHRAARPIAATDSHAHVLPVAGHIARKDEIQRLVETCLREFPQIDILVNNAGTNIAQEPALQVDEAKFDKMVEINLKSAFRLIQALGPGM